MAWNLKFDPFNQDKIVPKLRSADFDQNITNSADSQGTSVYHIWGHSFHAF